MSWAVRHIIGCSGETMIQHCHNSYTYRMKAHIFLHLSIDVKQNIIQTYIMETRNLKLIFQLLFLEQGYSARSTLSPCRVTNIIQTYIMETRNLKLIFQLLFLEQGYLDNAWSF